MSLWAPHAVAAALSTTTPMEEVSTEHPGHHHAAYPNLAGVKLGYWSMIPGGAEAQPRYVPGIQVGLFYERTLIHSWLELEVSAPLGLAFAKGVEVFLPLDIHLKKPFHPTPRLSPYVAAGPTFDFKLHPEVKLFFGGSLAVGLYVWISPRVGIDTEVDYNFVAEDHGITHELLVAVGPVVRF